MVFEDLRDIHLSLLTWRLKSVRGVTVGTGSSESGRKILFTLIEVEDLHAKYGIYHYCRSISYVISNCNTSS